MQLKKLKKIFPCRSLLSLYPLCLLKLSKTIQVRKRIIDRKNTNSHNPTATDTTLFIVGLKQQISASVAIVYRYVEQNIHCFSKAIQQFQFMFMRIFRRYRNKYRHRETTSDGTSQTYLKPCNFVSWLLTSVGKSTIICNAKTKRKLSWWRL